MAAARSIFSSYCQALPALDRKDVQQVSHGHVVPEQRPYRELKLAFRQTPARHELHVEREVSRFLEALADTLEHRIDVDPHLQVLDEHGRHGGELGRDVTSDPLREGIFEAIVQQSLHQLAVELFEEHADHGIAFLDAGAEFTQARRVERPLRS
jgi:hypothetical protein